MSVTLENAPLGFALVSAAGLSTGLGAALVFERRTVQLADGRVLAAGLAFSAGVMLYVCFADIFVEAQEAFQEAGHPKGIAYLLATVLLFTGMLAMWVTSAIAHMLDPDGEASLEEVDKAAREAQTPCGGTPHDAAKKAADPEVVPVDFPATQALTEQRKLRETGMKTALALCIHNMPEGLATFVATLAKPTVGVTLAVAIALHNVPEGLCVALPIFYATGSRLRAFLWGLVSGMSEPLGAVLGLVIIKCTGQGMSETLYGVLFSLVAGMMIMIAVAELLPTAYRYDANQGRITGAVVLGMAIMALSLCLLGL